MKIFDRVLVVFNHDQRVKDNPTLNHANNIAVKLGCVYCNDSALQNSDQFGLKRTSTKRQTFLAQSLEELNRNLKRLGQALTVLDGPVEKSLANLIDAHQINAVVYSQHVGVYEKKCWARLEKQFPHTEFHSLPSFTLFSENQLTFGEKFFQSFSQFRHKTRDLIVEPSQPPPTSLPASFLPPAAPVAAVLKTEETLNDQPPPASPSFDGAATGGESAAHNHMEDYFSGSAPLHYKETRNALDGWENSTKFSFWLANGNLSVRTLYYRVKHYEQLRGANDSTEWIVFELLWREFFQWYANHYAERLFHLAGISEKCPLTSFYPGRFKKWCEGSTPWPLVNACMKQLQHSGYISNRGRQIVASALVNELQLDWRCGAAYFEQQLLDYDMASNWGNWQYIAGVGADPRGGRHFNINKQHEIFDRENHFVNKWTAGARHNTSIDDVDAADWPIN